MAVVGVAFSIVTANLRFQISALRRHKIKAKLLYEASRKLAEAMIENQAFESDKEYFAKLFTVKYALLLPNLEELHIQQNTLAPGY